jgi:protein-tyrosine phosphatase
MVKVLFVCLGNICRSPMAHGVFQHMVNEAGLAEKIMVDSSGTASYHVGETPHRGTQKTLKDHGISFNHRARQLAHHDFSEYDYILAMDESNLMTIQSRKPKDSDAKIGMFLDYAEGASTREVPDPYYDGRFEEVYELVTAGAKGLLKTIREEHNL